MAQQAEVQEGSVEGIDGEELLSPSAEEDVFEKAAPSSASDAADSAGDADDASANPDVTALSDGSSDGSDSADASNAADAAQEAPEASGELGLASDGLELAASAQRLNIYRLYNPNSGEHFYTSSLSEAKSVAEAGWRWEGVGWVSLDASFAPVYRLYNPNAGDHHYTTSDEERDNLVKAGWKYEGISFYSDPNGAAPVYRQYNPNAVAGAHNFTTSEKERDSLESVGWRDEGIAWRATGDQALSISGFWLVTSAWGTLERYWIDSSAAVATSRLVDPAEGSGYWAYATNTGAILRGKLDTGKGYVYVANNDGKLLDASTDGWVVTGEYDGGGKQRYYVVAAMHAARSGHFIVDGNHYFGVGGQGYVLRNDHMVIDGTLYRADNAGLLTEHSVSGDVTLDGYLLDIYESQGTDLNTLFWWVSRFPYRSGDRWPTGEWSIAYAKEMYEVGSGNCYRYAALLCWLARGLGYDAKAVAGSVPVMGGWAAHGWVEIYQDGVTYICDSRMQSEYPAYNWYMRTYADAPCEYKL